MLRRRQINAKTGAAGAHSTLTVATNPVREVAWVVEERVMWRGADLLRGVADAARWPFERLAWLLERRLIWPVQERRASLGLPGLATGAAALAAILVGAGALSIVAMSGGKAEHAQVATATPAKLAIASQPAPSRPKPAPVHVLHGAPPVFGTTQSVGAAQATSAPAPRATTETKATAVAATSSAKSVPAGPAAMKVARRFAEAFVFYEIGERPARARTVFEETATPRLSEALAERPPRLPEQTKVPKARVVNLVPGPRHDKAYTVSVSLLRLGVTSEMRIDLQRDEQGDGWQVTDVVG